MAKKLAVGLFFGGRSTEHEVSVITALQAYQNTNLEKYQIIPIYGSKQGEFYTSPKFLNLKNYKDLGALLLSSSKITFGKKDGKGGILTQGLFPKFVPLDVAFLCFHGSFGEDGSIQGALELNSIPYTGFNVLGSAISMDKTLSKILFQSLGLNVGKYIEINRTNWNENSRKILKDLQKNLKYPLFVKPSNIGSSIGINIAQDEDSLSFGIEVGFTYSERVLIEEAFENCVEVNCSVLGYDEEIKASVCEMPKASKELLSFEDKYQKGSKGSKGSKGMASLDRIIPAPISASLTKKIQDATIKVFKAMNGCGVVRIDYFVDEKKGKFWINELNAIPGSLAFYLWEESNLHYKELIDELINYALTRFQNQQKTQYTFDSGLLEQMAKSEKI